MDLPKNMQLPYDLALSVSAVAEKILNFQPLTPDDLEKLKSYNAYCKQKKLRIIRRMEYAIKRDLQ